MVKKFYKNKLICYFIILFLIFNIYSFKVESLSYYSNDNNIFNSFLSSFSIDENSNSKIIDIIYFFKNKLFYKTILLSLSIVSSEIELKKFNNEELNLLYYILGVSYFYINDFKNAEKYFSKITKEYLKFYYDFYEFYIGVIFFLNEQYNEATIWFNKISKLEDKISELGKYYYYFALSLIQIEQYDLALYFLQKGLESKEENYKPYYSFTIGRLYFNLSLFDKAEIEFRRFLLKYSNSDLIDDSLYFLGKTYYKQKKLKEAKDEFLILIKNYPDSEYLFYSYYYLGKITSNPIYYEYIVANKSDFENIDYVYYYLGKIYIDNLDLSIAYFEKCIELTKDNILAYNSIVYLLNYSKNNDEKINLVLKYIDKIENKDKILNYCLNLIYNEQKFDYFDTLIKDYISKNFDLYKYNFDILFNIGRIYNIKKEFQKSLDYFFYAYQINSEDYKLNYYIGYTYFEIKNIDESFKFIKTSLEKNTKKDIYYQLSLKIAGFYNIEKNNFQEAYKIFDQFLNQFPKSPIYYEILYYYSIVSFNLKKYDLAYNSIKLCLNNVSKNDSLYNNVIYYSIKIISKKNLIEAFSLYKNEAYLYDNDLSLAIFLLNLLINAKNYDEALNFADFIYKNGNEEKKIEAKIKKYLIYFNLKDYENAYNEIKTIENISSNYKKEFIVYYLFEINFILKNQSFYDYYNKLKKFNNNKLIFEASYMLFSNFFKEKKYKETLIFLDESIKYTNDPGLKNSLLFNKANILIEIENYKEAIIILENLFDLKYNIEVVNNLLFNLYVKVKDIDKIIDRSLYNIYENKDENLKYISLIYLIYLKEFNKLDDESFLKVADYLIEKKYSDRLTNLALYIRNYYYLKDFDKFKKDFRINIQSSDIYISFWARFYFALYYIKTKDYKNAYNILETLIGFDLNLENEIVYYYLFFLESNSFVGNKKYIDLNKFISNSIILGLINK
jgi:tetratricopeptide (TPR) repeat protein